MLSIENPPPDPPCPCEISQLKSSDERASDKLALQEVDLVKSGLDDNNDPLPKFSIRDYVFSTRSKDIKTNWPFSQQNLQLCLKHGVTDILPPFQPLYSVRNRSVRSCAVETGSLDKENISNSDGEPSAPSHHLVSDDISDEAGCDQKLAVDCVNINSSGSEGDKEFPSPTTSQSHSETDSVPTDRSPCLALEADRTLLEASAAELEAAVPSASHKTESTIQPPVKKCRLIVKLSNVADPSSNEDSTSNNFVVSETMASKVCPVCKTFSSSSNTTLNAHIDQCLSGASTIKWTANSKVIKNRIKPRKTRLMVDIYVTAPHCTLEDLDRRNGTSWAANSSLPTQETEVCAEEREQRVSPVNLEDPGNEGAVYFDANGTKLRILSKFNDVSSVSKVEEDPGRRKFLRGKVSKFLPTKKKKRHAQKHHKFLKPAPQSKIFFSSKPCRSYEVCGAQETSFAVEESCEKEERLTQPVKAQEQIKLNDSGTIRRWVCSKRSGLTKKTNGKDDNQRSGYNATKDLLVESDQSSLGDSYAERSCVLKTPNLSDNPISSPESRKRMDVWSYEHQVDEYREQPLLAKRVEFSLLGSRVGGDGKRLLVLPKQNARQLRKCSDSDSFKDPPSHTENHVSSPSNKTIEINAGPDKNSDSFVISSKPSGSHHAFSSKARRFSSLRKNLLSVSRASVPESKFNLKRKCSALKKSRVHCISGSEEAAVVWPSEVDQQLDYMQNYTEKQSGLEKITDKMSLGRTSVLKIRKKRGATKISRKEETVALKSSPSAPQCYDHDVGGRMDSSVRVVSALVNTFDDVKSARKGIQTTEPASRIAVRGSFMSLSKALDPEFHKLGSPSDAQCDSQRYVEVYNGPLCGAEAPMCSTEPSLGDGQEIFCADEVGNGMIRQNTQMGADLDSKVGQGNYFLEVDPIPIPGPPGSFLPSPGHLGSEDLQGSSSLTTSRVQSCEDHHDLVDRDSSDSPISAISTISNPTVARSDSRSSEKLSVRPHAVQDEIRSGLSGAIVDLVVENSAPVPQAANIGAERVNPGEFKANVIFPEKGPLSFKNDQPCCCSRKEVASQGVALNYQESQLLRRRTMASVPLPAIGKQMNCDPNKRHNSLNSKSGMFTPSNHPSSGPEKVVFPTMKSPVGPFPMEISTNSEVKFPIRGDCESASPSASNPVLRLMGKNLMVVNKDEDVSAQLRQVQSSTMNDQNPQFRTVSAVSPGHVQNEDFHSFHHVVPQGPIIFGQNHSVVAQRFDVRSSNSFRSNVHSETPQIPPHASAVMFPSKNVTGGFAASLEPHEYKGGCNLLTEQNRPKNRLDTPLTYDMEKVVIAPGPQHRNVESASDSIKEIIIIDDTPESEADSVIEATYNEGMRKSWVSSAGISMPMASEYNSRHVNSFYGYQPQGASPYGGSSVPHNESFQMPPSRVVVTASPIKWNCTPDGSSVLHSSSLTPSSSSTGHPRSTLYYSSSFS